MKKTVKFVQKTVTNADIFDDAVHLNMEGDRSITTCSGGLLSIGVTIFILVQATLQLKTMFTFSNPSIIEISEYKEDPGGVMLNDTNNFVLAVSMSYNNSNMNISNGSLVSFTATYSQYIRSSDGSVTKIKPYIYWAPCNFSNFPEELFGVGVYLTYSLNYAYCAKYINYTDTTTGACPSSIKENYPDCITPPHVNIQGIYLSTYFDFISFKLTTCTKSAKPYVKHLNCNSGNITQIMKYTTLKLNLYYANTLILPLDHKTPNKTFLDNVYWNVDPSVAKMADIFVDTEIVQDHDKFFSNTDYSNRTYYSIESSNMREQQDFEGVYMLNWNLRRSNLNRITYRTYTNILNVISNIGGISSIMMLAGAFLIMGYNNYKYKMKMSNELYNFQPPNEMDQPEPKPYSIKEAMKDTKDTNDNSRSMTQDQVKVGKTLFAMLPRRSNAVKGSQTIKEYFLKQKKKSRALRFNEFTYIRLLCCWCCLRHDKEEIIARRAREQVVKDIDIIKVIQKLQEIDKLKLLLLNQHQREAFNFIEKPVIGINTVNPQHRQSGIDTEPDLEAPRTRKKSHFHKADNDDYSKLSNYAKLYKAYRFLKEDQDHKNVLYNKKLLGMMGEDLIRVFSKVDIMLEGNNDPRRYEETVIKILEQPLDGILRTDSMPGTDRVLPTVLHTRLNSERGLTLDRFNSEVFSVDSARLNTESIQLNTDPM